MNKGTYTEYLKEYRQRPYVKAKRKEYQKKYKKGYRQRPEVKARRKERKTLPHVQIQMEANAILQNAVNNGIMERGNCEHCGSNEDIQGHHEDYSKPLEVIWLCPPCHGQHHSEVK